MTATRSSILPTEGVAAPIQVPVHVAAGQGWRPHLLASESWLGGAPPEILHCAFPIEIDQITATICCLFCVFGAGKWSMAAGSHETYTADQVKPPSERSTGIVFTIVAVIVAVFWRHEPIVPWVALAVAGALSALSLVAPSVLKPLNLVWFRIGLLLHRVVNPLVMLAIFAVVIVPAGLIMRVWYDPLRSQRAKSDSSYWIDRSSSAESMTNQF